MRNDACVFTSSILLSISHECHTYFRCTHSIFRFNYQVNHGVVWSYAGIWQTEKGFRPRSMQTDLCRLLFFNPFPNKPWFLRVCITSLWKTLLGKEKLLLFPQCFLSILTTLCHFHQI